MPKATGLERQGAISVDWTTSENDQRARLYRLTPAGRRNPPVERSNWEQLEEAIAGVLTKPAGSRA